MKVDHSKLTFFSSGTPGGSRRLQYAVIALSLLVFLALFFYAWEGRSTYDRDGAGITYETARVLAVLVDNTEADPSAENVLRGSQDLELEILTGRYAGETVRVTNYLSAFYNVIAREGMKLSVSVNTVEEGVYSVSVYNYSRDLWIWAFGALFALALFAVGGKQGLKALAGLGAEERQIVLLHAVAGLKHREIAQLLELPLSTVLSKYHRGLKKLRAQMKGESDR